MHVINKLSLILRYYLVNSWDICMIGRLSERLSANFCLFYSHMLKYHLVHITGGKAKLELNVMLCFAANVH